MHSAYTMNIPKEDKAGSVALRLILRTVKLGGVGLYGSTSIVNRSFSICFRSRGCFSSQLICLKLYRETQSDGWKTVGEMENK